MTTFAPVREARRLWERTAPQLTLDFDELPDARTAASRLLPPSAGTRPAAHIGSGTATPSVPGTADRWANLPEPCASEGRPDPTYNTNGGGRASIPAHAPSSSQEEG